MPFVAEQGSYRIVDAERGWEMKNDGGISEYNFLLCHADGSTIKFTAKEVGHERLPEGTVFQWEVSSTVAHKPAPTMSLMSKGEQRELICDALAAYGSRRGGGISVQVKFL